MTHRFVYINCLYITLYVSVCVCVCLCVCVYMHKHTHPYLYPPLSKLSLHHSGSYSQAPAEERKRISILKKDELDKFNGHSANTEVDSNWIRASNDLDFTFVLCMTYYCVILFMHWRQTGNDEPYLEMRINCIRLYTKMWHDHSWYKLVNYVVELKTCINHIINANLFIMLQYLLTMYKLSHNITIPTH